MRNAWVFHAHAGEWGAGGSGREGRVRKAAEIGSEWKGRRGESQAFCRRPIALDDPRRMGATVVLVRAASGPCPNICKNLICFLLVQRRHRHPLPFATCSTRATLFTALTASFPLFRLHPSSFPTPQSPVRYFAQQLTRDTTRYGWAVSTIIDCPFPACCQSRPAPSVSLTPFYFTIINSINFAPSSLSKPAHNRRTRRQAHYRIFSALPRRSCLTATKHILPPFQFTNITNVNVILHRSPFAEPSCRCSGDDTRCSQTSRSVLHHGCVWLASIRAYLKASSTPFQYQPTFLAFMWLLWHIYFVPFPIDTLHVERFPHQ